MAQSVKGSRVFVFYTGHSYQPIGVFSEKKVALRYAYEKGLWGNVAEYCIDVPLPQRVDQISNRKDKRFDDAGPEQLARFSSAYVVRVALSWDDERNIVIRDYDTGETGLLADYLSEHDTT
ncbi:hypothetical protein [Frigidibacter sp. SD6-1]|uniref:hypothetical protein n=1 Tax=Frigidibacter sp. SD6-1 TaxID=3032581 RepID=UPI0024E03107|nr:hypothetical protein [Frigidibacter sp. SD6-1]